MKTKTISRLIAGAAATACCFSCIEVNSQMASELIPTNQQFDIYTTEFYLDEMEVRMADSLSAYSSDKIAIGAVRDETFGLTTRGCALTLVPIASELDFGTKPEFTQFHFSAEPDTVSYADPGQMHILQNVNVYELSEAISTDESHYATTSVKHNPGKVTKGVPVYAMGDSLSFDFAKSFGEKYLTISEDDLSDMSKYTAKFPGIYLCTDEPVGNGGRIDLFKLALDFDSQYYYISGNYAELKFNSEYDGERKDTSFLFYFSPVEFENLDSLLTNSGTPTQYALNVSSYESDKYLGQAGEYINVEGGAGIKPVIPASHLRDLCWKAIESKGDPSKAVITKATVELPFVFPDNYEDMYLYPDILSPTVRVKSDTSLAFAGLTDSSISDENQGDINRSVLKYTPDITHHIQALLRMDDSIIKNPAKLSNYDVWFLIMRYETKTTSNSNQDLSDYYTQLAYQSYYNNMYGGYGYSSGYGYDSYTNYYNYLMMAQYASSATSTSTSSVLDQYKFYNAKLVGPKSTSKDRPKVKLTFAIPKAD